MSISFGSVIMCVIATSLLLIYFEALLRMKTSVFMQGIRIVFCGVILLFIRLLVPVNFPFTITIPSEKLILHISDFILLTKIAGHSLAKILGMIWIFGALIHLTRFAIKLHKSTTIIQQAEMLDCKCKKNINLVLKELNAENVRCVIFNEMGAPAITGLFNPILVMPDFNYTIDELRFIISHEIMHYKKHDLIVKYLLEVCRCIYWWNPIMYIFAERFLLVVEIANDLTVTCNFSESRKKEYARCLIKYSKLCSQGTMLNNSINFTAIPFVTNKKLKTRIIKLMHTNETTPSKLLEFSEIFIFVFVMLAGLLIVPEAYQISPVVQETTFSIDNDNAYLVKTADGFDLYVNDKYVSSMSIIDENLKSLKVYMGVENEKRTIIHRHANSYFKF